MPVEMFKGTERFRDTVPQDYMLIMRYIDINMFAGPHLLYGMDDGSGRTCLACKVLANTDELLYLARRKPRNVYQSLAVVHAHHTCAHGKPFDHAHHIVCWIFLFLTAQTFRYVGKG